jgi:hypothetical protein
MLMVAEKFDKLTRIEDDVGRRKTKSPGVVSTGTGYHVSLGHTNQSIESKTKEMV